MADQVDTLHTDEPGPQTPAASPHNVSKTPAPTQALDSSPTPTPSVTSDAPTLAPNPDATTYPITTRKREKASDEQVLKFLTLVESGTSARAAAIQCGVNIRTAWGWLARVDDDVEALRGATRKLMVAQALDRLDDWRTASQVGAAKRGNHGPAKDWLLHAGVIDSVQGEGTSVKVAICIGTPEKPMRIPSPLSVQVDTDDH